LVDDGSRDRTPVLLKEAVMGDDRFRIVTHEVNRGLGAAIRTGFQHASGDIVVTTDFDRTYDYATIPTIIDLLESSGADLVTASPYHPEGAVMNVPQYRLLFSYGASLLYRLLVSWHIHTWTALFRAYRRAVIEAVTFESDDFLAGAEILVRTIQKGYRVTEYPTTLHSRTFGQSSIRIAKVTIAHIKFQLRLLKEGVFPASRPK
jgi:dolichol-phosphate mannosyltransferase